MPIYEYSCQICSATSSFFARSVNKDIEPLCSTCGTKTFTEPCPFSRTTPGIHTEYGPPPEHHSLEYFSDPRNIGRSVEERFSKMGVEMPRSLKQRIQTAREGAITGELDY